VSRALREDLGDAGDLTSDAVLDSDSRGRGVLVAKAPGVVAGLGVAEEAFRQVDSRVEVVRLRSDGDRVEPGDSLLVVEGSTASILAAERTALNFLGRMSGIASATRRCVDAISGTAARVTCTRKTAPGLRALDKYAVRVGGGVNHRFGLYDAILIKDNHLVACGGDVAEAVRRARAGRGRLVQVEVEVTSLEQAQAAVLAGAEALLLDNLSPEQVSEVVAWVAGRATTEASGGIHLENVRRYAEAGVDFVSLGWLTHSSPVLDISLELSSLQG
jgi:nicotinate-nucleotide pyrophosphorylase (carboxylating)